MYTMSYLTEEQLNEVWEERGLKDKMIRFRKFLVERGLLPLAVTERLFLDHVHDEILNNFFVKGVKYHKDGRIEYESD